MWQEQQSWQEPWQEQQIQPYVDPSAQAAENPVPEYLIIFQPGALGIGMTGLGSVKTVMPDGQAASLGVQVGWALKKINGEPYTKELFDKTKQSGNPWTASFIEEPFPPSAPTEPAQSQQWSAPSQQWSDPSQQWSAPSQQWSSPSGAKVVPRRYSNPPPVSPTVFGPGKGGACGGCMGGMKGMGGMSNDWAPRPAGNQMCSLHGKNRSPGNLEEDGMGGWKCRMGMECQVGGMGGKFAMQQQMATFGTVMPGVTAICSIHGKNRSVQSLMDDGCGGQRCAPGYECRVGPRDGPY